MKNSDQPAFGYGLANNSGFKEAKGLTKREYFAGFAMQAILSNPSYLNLDKDPFKVANLSIFLADELLKQLENNG